MKSIHLRPSASDEKFSKKKQNTMAKIYFLLNENTYKIKEINDMSLEIILIDVTFDETPELIFYKDEK